MSVTNFNIAAGTDSYNGKPLVGMNLKVVDDTDGDFGLPIVDLQDPFYKITIVDEIFEIQSIKIPYIENKVI